MELLRFPEKSSPQKLAHLFSSDENWFDLDNPRNSTWRDPEFSGHTSQKEYWSSESYHLNLLLEVQNLGCRDVASWERFNRDFCIDEVFERDDERRREPRKRTDDITLSHIHSTRSHLVQSKFDSMGIHGLRDLVYGSNIALCDFWLFGYFKMKLEAMFFTALVTILAQVEEILGDIGLAESVKVFDEWNDGLKRYIDPEGEYLENN
jgi:hypothetical protein